MHSLVADLDWERTLELAIAHRLGPLLYTAMREYGIASPTHVNRTLASILLRQRSIAAVQTATLAELISALRAAGIDSVVLKGGALAHLIYREPGLRPMEDLDVLVPADQADAARRVLAELGFQAPAAATRYERLQHHLPIAQRVTDGVCVSVEVHVRAFNLIMAEEIAYDDLDRPLLRYAAGGQFMCTLSPSQLLWMQYHGLRKLAEPLRLLQIADLVGIAERWVEAIDWDRVKNRYPDLWHALAAVHALSPFGEAVCAVLGLEADRPPTMRHLGEDYDGWPRRAISEARSGRDRLQLLSATLLPPEWWTRFVYGVPRERRLLFALLVRHPGAFVTQGLRRLYLGPVRPGAFFKTPV
jgi:hypothetical protein